MSTASDRREIKRLIVWYEARGHDWAPAVEFLCAAARGWTPEREAQRTQDIAQAGYLRVMGEAGVRRRARAKEHKWKSSPE